MLPVLSGTCCPAVHCAYYFGDGPRQFRSVSNRKHSSMFLEAVPIGDGTSNLMPLAEAGKASHLTLIALEGSGSAAHATVSVNSLGPLDLLQVAVSGLKPGKMYRLWLVASRTQPFGQKEELVTFKTNLAGAQIAQTIGPLRQVLTSESEKTSEPRLTLLSLSTQ
jgi:hypothetical protein